MRVSVQPHASYMILKHFYLPSALISKRLKLQLSSDILFLHEAPLGALLGAKLPMKLSIFKHFWHHYKSLGKGCNIAVRDTAKSVITCWQNAGLHLKKIDCIIVDITIWFNQYKVCQTRI